jgi:ABC-type lipoprotein release transport system permease subunit
MIGVGLGLAGALASRRLIEALLTAVALLACWLSARRASRLSPLEALRAD